MVNTGRSGTKSTELGTGLGLFYPESVFFLEKREIKVERKKNYYFHFYMFYKGIN